MIEGKNFIIYEHQDVVDACDNIEEAANAIAGCLRQWNHEGKGEQDACDFMGNILTVLSAAGVGAAVCEYQGGIVIIKEGATKADRQEAMKALDALRKTTAAPLSDETPLQ